MPSFPSNRRGFCAPNAVPAPGRIPFLLLACALTLAGCASAARYTRGPLPLSALPPARITMTTAPRPGGTPEEIADGKRSGTVRRVSLDHDPLHGFTVWMVDPLGMAIRLRVDTLLEDVRPDLPRGRLLTVDRLRKDGDRVRLDDDRGSVAWFLSGSHVPEMPANLPFAVAASPRRAFTRMFAASDLCRWTVVHTFQAVTPSGGPTELLAPGEARLFDTPSGTYLFAALDAATPEESDCGQEAEPQVAWFWVRVSEEDARKLRTRYPSLTTEPRDAGSGMPSPSRSPPPNG